MCEICSVIGRSVIVPRAGPKLEEWIDYESDFKKQPIVARIRKNISYYLGNAEQTFKLSEAATKLFNRDYEGKKQIFVPEIFLTKHPGMIFTEKTVLDEKLTNPNLTKEEVGKLRCQANTVSGESLEKNVFDSLKEYFNNHSDQEVLVLHGYEVMELDTLKSLDRCGKMRQQIQKKEKDFIIINKTLGYILAIEAKTTLDPKSIKKSRIQLENTKSLLEKWFGADLKHSWHFFSAIYCEKGDKYSKLCGKCNWDYIFTGSKDLLAKLENIQSICESSKKVSLHGGTISTNNELNLLFSATI